MNRPPNPWETHWFHIIQGTFKLLAVCIIYNVVHDVLKLLRYLTTTFYTHFKVYTDNQKCYFVYVRFDKAQPLKHWYAPDHFRWKCLHECSPLLTEFSSAAVKLTAKLVIIEKIQGCSSVRFQTALLSHLLQQMILSAVPQDGSLR